MARRRQEIGVRFKRGKYQVFARIDGKFRSVPGGLPADSTPGERAAARDRLIEQYGGAPVVAGSLAGDVAEYLARPEVKAMVGIRQRRCDLARWIEALGPHRSRRGLAREEVEAVLQTWLARYAPATVYHRRTALRSLFVTVDGPHARNPVDGTTRPAHFRPVDRSQPFPLMARIVAAMRDDYRVTKGIRRPSFAKLRAAVMLHTGIPPAELKKLQAHHLDLAHAFVRMPWRDKGEGTPAHRREVSADGIAALQAFAAAGAFGPFPTSSLSHSFKAAARRLCGAATAIRLYDLRHTLGADAYRATRDLATVGRLLGHAPGSPVTTRYAMGAHADVDRAALEAVARARTEKPLKLPAKLPAGRNRRKTKTLRRAS